MAGSTTTLKEAQLRYWQAFHDYLRANSQLVKEGKLKPIGPEELNLAGFKLKSAGLSSHRINTFINLQDKPSPKVSAKSIAVALTLKDGGGSIASELYAALEEEKEAIEREVGAKLRWLDRDNVNSRRTILLENTRENPALASRREQQFQWLAETMERFYRAFVPRLERLLQR